MLLKLIHENEAYEWDVINIFKSIAQFASEFYVRYLSHTPFLKKKK